MKEEYKGRKKAKQRHTVAFFSNAAGGKKPPIVIEKAAHPRCFKRIKVPKKQEGIPYYSNPKAWMNSDIMGSILNVLNKWLVKQERILLFIV